MKLNFSIFSISTPLSLMLVAQPAEPQSASKISPREASLISHLVQQARQPGYHAKDSVYLSVQIGETEYISELKSSKIVMQRKARFPGGNLCGDYAAVRMKLLDKNKKQHSQGGGQVLKRNAGKWESIASAEGDYACKDLEEISQPMMRCLNIDCL